MAIKIAITTNVDEFTLTDRDNGKRSIVRAISGRIWVVWRSATNRNIIVSFSDDGGGTWTDETAVAVNTGFEPRQMIMLDGNDVPHIVYQTTPGADLIRYTNRIGGVWSAPQTVHTSAAVLSLDGAAIDSGNNIHILLTETIAAQRVHYYRRDGTTGIWGAREVVNALGAGNEIAVDSSGDPYAVYWGGTHLDLRIRSGVGWGAPIQVSTVAFGPLTNETASIALDGSNNLHVAWAQDGFAPNAADKQIRYRKRTGGAWGTDLQVSFPTNGENYESPILILDTNGNGYVIYQEQAGAADETAYWREIINEVVGAEQTLDGAITRPGNHSSLYTGLWGRFNADSVLLAKFQPVAALLDETTPGNYTLWFYAAILVVGGGSVPPGKPSSGGQGGQTRGFYMTTRVQQSSFSRMWLIENRAGPANQPSYESLWKAGAVSWALGDSTNIYVPRPSEYGQFDVAGKIVGDRGSPTLPLTARYRQDSLSTLLRLARLSCDHDLQVHMGACRDPMDFNRGWEKILMLESARPSEYATTDLGALQPDERGVVNEEVPFMGEEFYEVVPLIFSEQAADEGLLVQKVIDIEVCDAISCGECAIVSDGCQVVFALTLTVGGSPGLAAELLFTENGGTLWDDTLITTLAADQDPNALACVGINVVVISEDSESIHYAPILDILDGSEGWLEEDDGFVAGNGPLAIVSLSPRHTWIVGEGGYIYFTADPTLGVEVQDAGVATLQNLNAVHAYDFLNVVAVGVSNALVLTRNGGETWTPLPGPIGAVNLLTVWMRTPDEWFVGAADGNLYYTRDGGSTWVQKEFPGDGAGSVHEVKFTTPTVGWMAHSTGAPVARILRTVDGGFSWYVLPEGNTNMPTATQIVALAVCQDANIVWGAGEKTAGGDGIIVKGEGG